MNSSDQGISRMRIATILTTALFGFTAAAALAQPPARMDPATGARPGHQPGVRELLPLSSNASNISPADSKKRHRPDAAGVFHRQQRQPSGLPPPACASPVAGKTGAHPASAGDGRNPRARPLRAPGPDRHAGSVPPDPCHPQCPPRARRSRQQASYQHHRFGFVGLTIPTAPVVTETGCGDRTQSRHTLSRAILPMKQRPGAQYQPDSRDAQADEIARETTLERFHSIVELL